MSRNWLKGRKSIPAEKNVARECERIKTVEDVSKKLLKEGKKLSDATVIAGRSAARIGTDLSTLTTGNGEKCEFGAILEKSVEDARQLSQEKNHLIQKTLVEPMRRYNSTFSQLNNHIKGHEKAQQEYKRIQSKVDKLKDKEETGPNVVKMQNLKKELSPVQKEFEMKHSMLLDEFPAFYNNRLMYLQPIFESLISSQCCYHHRLNGVFENALEELTQNDPNRDLDAEVQDTLDQIRSLSITKD